jgi:hypothetical protein
VICFKCGRSPSEIPEYQCGDFWEEGEYDSPEDFIIQNEGTYNPKNGHFACTECYIAIGMPSSPQGWKAP